jgi:hypothetical protein
LLPAHSVNRSRARLGESFCYLAVSRWQEATLKPGTGNVALANRLWNRQKPILGLVAGATDDLASRMGTWGNPPWGTFVPLASLGTEVRGRAASEEAGIHHPAGRRAGSRSSSEEADGPCRSASAAPKGRRTGSRCRHREKSPEGFRCFSVEHPSSLNPGGFGDDLVNSEESERARRVGD